MPSGTAKALKYCSKAFIVTDFDDFSFAEKFSQIFKRLVPYAPIFRVFVDEGNDGSLFFGEGFRFQFHIVAEREEFLLTRNSYNL